MKLFSKSLLAAASLALTAQSQALDFDFNGVFAHDNDVVGLSFVVGANSNITIFSSSWLSGANPAGFDPILAIWDSAGNLISQQDDGGVVGSTLSNGVLYNHGTWDSYFSVNLAPGTYLATIAQFNNFSVSSQLADGFMHDGPGGENFTFDLNYGGATQPMFNGVWDNNHARNGNWEFHILNVESATNTSSVPDGGSTVALMGLALSGFALIRRKLAVI